MAARVNHIISRASSMSLHELRTRLAQEFGKRKDWYLYRLGHRPTWQGQGPVQAGRPGHFFFESKDLPDRMELVRSRLSGQADRILTEAEKLCAHKFDLLGYENLDFGPEIDWHFDPVNRKQVPLRPWFRIDFLNFDSVGDHKIIWELNRHQHLLTLAKAWLLGGEERFAKEIVAQWYDWQRANPYPLGINWASTLEVAFRSISWIWLARSLEGCTGVPARFHNDLVSATAFNASYMERFLSTYFSPNTHLLGEALALFFIGTQYPGLKASAGWRTLGWRILLEEAQKQVRPDGVYFEQSLYYHVYALDFFLHARQLAMLNKIAVPGEFDSVLNRMADVIQSLCQAGPPEGFGDDDGGRLFDPRRNHTEHTVDPLALAAVMFKRHDLPSAGLTEEALWLFGPQATKHFEHASTDRPAASCAFPDGGVYVIASEARIPTQITIDAGPQGTGKSGHGHADALSIRVAISGRRFLVDSGSGCYVCPGDTRNRLRGTAAHNTVRIDGQDQAIPQGPFAWSSLPQVVTDRWIVGKSFTFYSGHHTGYLRLQDPVLHRRDVLHIDGSFCLVRDVLTGKEMHEVEIAWHLAPDLVMENSQGAFVASADGTKLAVLPDSSANWLYASEKYQISPAYGKLKSAIRVAGRAKLELPEEHGTLLIAGAAEIGRFTRVQTAGPAALYRYEDLAGSHCILFSDQAGRWSCPPFAGDCKLLYLLLENDEVKRLILCDGSRAEYKGKTIVQNQSSVQRFERDQHSGMTEASSSDSVKLHPVS